MNDIYFKETLQEIVDRIEDEVLGNLSKDEYDFYAADKVNDVLDIINEYI